MDDEAIASLRPTNKDGWTDMSSSGKKKTTMAKLMRESKLRERRVEKQIKKDARKLAAATRSDHPDAPDAAPQPAGELVAEPLLDA